MHWMASGARPFLVDRWVPRGLSQRVLATRGQTDMRGLVTAGRAVRLELGRWSICRAWPLFWGCS